MVDAAEIHKAEFEQLMAENRMHQTTASAVFSLALAVLGVGTPIALQYPNVLPILAAVVSILWLRYLGHVSGIFRVAAYVSLELRPALERSVTRTSSDDELLPLLGWEVFYRRLRAGQYVFTDSNGVTRRLSAERFRERVLGLDFTSIFFGVSPPAMIAPIYFTDDSMRMSLVVPLSVMCLGLWIVSLLRWRSTVSTIQEINDLIDLASP